jgi:flagellar motility protein MotE (MotC chaperone)
MNRIRLRLLPSVVAALALLAVVKLALLVLPAGQQAAPSVMLGAARANSPPPPAAAPAPPPPPPPATPPEPTPEQRAEQAVLEGLRARRGALDQREQSIAEREAVLAAAEKRLTQRIGELSTVQQRLDATSRSLTEQEEKGWRQMVKLYEGMRPRDAATIFDDLEMPVLLEILGRMGERKAAPVLAAMKPERARLLTTELARSRAKPAD